MNFSKKNHEHRKANRSFVSKKHYLTFLFLVFFCLGFAQTKDSLSLEELQHREKNIQAGNPFKKFGYKPKIATLSQGKYLEFHDLDSIVKIGSFSYHVKNKTITGYSQEETKYSEATLKPEIVSRWFSPDPLSEEFPSWSPYNYAMDNPIIFVDPTGMFAELFDENGNKIGEDENGNDGNVSIVPKEIVKDVKKGNTTVNEAIDKGVQTTKTVLKEAINVINRTEDNGGLQEEVSVVTAENKVVRGERGSAEVVNIDGVNVIKSTVPDAPTEGSTLIHSHQTGIGKDANGSPTAGNAKEPGPLDPSVFGDYKQNIIVGRLGKTTQNADGSFNQPKLGAAIYSNNITVNSSPILTLVKRTIEKIIKN